MGFNSRSEGFLYTIGSNGDLNVWDIMKRNKILTEPFTNPLNSG